MLQLARLGRGKCRQRDDAHCLLRVGETMSPCHVTSAQELQLSKCFVNRPRSPFSNNQEQHSYTAATPSRGCGRGADHGQNLFWEKAVPSRASSMRIYIGQ